MANKQTKEQVEAKDDGLMSLKETAAYVGVTDQRVRNLLTQGRIQATKNEKGYWRVSREACDAYKATKGARSGKKAWVIRIEPEQTEVVRELLATYGIDMEPRYKPAVKKTEA